MNIKREKKRVIERRNSRTRRSHGRRHGWLRGVMVEDAEETGEKPRLRWRRCETRDLAGGTCASKVEGGSSVGLLCLRGTSRRRRARLDPASARVMRAVEDGVGGVLLECCVEEMEARKLSQGALGRRSAMELHTTRAW